MNSINIVTLFPEFFESPFNSGLLGKFRKKQCVTFNIVDIREFSPDKFKRCDDYPYGGGSGMVLTPGPLFDAFESIQSPGEVVLTTPSGKRLDQNMVKELADFEDITIVCGHYEGVDQRFIDSHVTREISIGDYVLSGGEFAALIIVDAFIRYQPGFMSNPESLEEESFEEGLLEYPHYTRPESYKGMNVPEVLLSGHHKKIRQWRQEKAIDKTKRVRPDLYQKYIMELNER